MGIPEQKMELCFTRWHIDSSKEHNMKLFSASFHGPCSALLLGGALGMVACAPADDPTMPCPPVTINADLAHMEIKSADAKDAVLARAEIEGYRRSCRYTEKSVEITLQFRFHLTKEPAYSGEAVNLSYFAAVPAFYPSEQARTLVPLRADLPENRETVDIIDDEVHLTLPRGESRQGAELEIIAGFQTAPDQLDRLWGKKTKPGEDKVPRKVPRR